MTAPNHPLFVSVLAQIEREPRSNTLDDLYRISADILGITETQLRSEVAAEVADSGRAVREVDALTPADRTAALVKIGRQLNEEPVTAVFDRLLAELVALGVDPAEPSQFLAVQAVARAHRMRVPVPADALATLGVVTA